MATEKRLIDANALIEVLRKSHSYHAKPGREFSLLCRDIRLVKEAPTVNAMELPKGRPGDYMEWSNGVSTRFFQISAIYICKDCVRYDIGDLCPVIDHENIIRILTPEEMKREMKHEKP